MPSLVDVAGLGIFLLYLVLLWEQLRQSYETIVGVRKNVFVHVGDKLRICLALILPWLVVNVLHDLVLLVPPGGVHNFIISPRGEALFLLLVIGGAVIWFPAVLMRLLGCTPMPAGTLRGQVEGFCRAQGVRFRQICLWPIVDGKILTAGVVGLVGRYRYLLLTPALLATLSEEELKAVVAHEIGHVKKHHLLLYLLLFLGLAGLLQLCVQPLLALLLTSSWAYEFLFGYEGDPELALTILTGGPLVLGALVYFRYLFGFFMRNFERQADLYAAKVLGDGAPLINVFQKIIRLSGNHRDTPCWHHFSLGQRIDYLLRCRADDNRPKLHAYKVYLALVAYVGVLALALALTMQIPDRLISAAPGRQLAEEVVLKKIERDPGNPLWHQFHGDLLAARRQYQEAILAFERSLQLYPDNPEALNNLAWLLLTAEQRTLLDPVRALALAKKAVALQARSHILDTLAEAYWQNGLAGLAIATEQRAVAESSGNREYYLQQLRKFNLDERS
jgi:Zn-dependent protease with chaperone function